MVRYYNQKESDRAHLQTFNSNTTVPTTTVQKELLAIGFATIFVTLGVFCFCISLISIAVTVLVTRRIYRKEAQDDGNESGIPTPKAIIFPAPKNSDSETEKNPERSLDRSDEEELRIRDLIRPA
ncbi:unnamed protein product [Caenorhabditis brenneri]